MFEPHIDFVNISGPPANNADAEVESILQDIVYHCGLADAHYYGKSIAGQVYERDILEAAAWWMDPAHLGVAAAQNNLGACYHHFGAFPKAIEWWKKAAEQESTTAMKNLGHCFYHGQGVKRNIQEAAVWYAQAALRGDYQHHSIAFKIQKELFTKLNLDEFGWLCQRLAQRRPGPDLCRNMALAL